MAKPVIVTRNGKGSHLTFTEHDTNFTNLRDATISIGVQGGDTVVNDLNDVTTLIATDGINIVANGSSQTIAFDASLAQDTSPQLAGNLDVQTYKITTTVTNGNIEIDPPGTGKVIISGDLQVDGTTTTINSTTLDVDDVNITLAKGAANAAAANGGGITLEGPTTPATILYTSTDDAWNFNKDVVFEASIRSTTNNPVVIAPDGTGDVHLNTDSVRIGDNNADATIVTRGTGDLILTTNEGSATEGVIRIYDGANGNITLTPNGTGRVQLDGLNYPSADGTSGQFITTDGAGNLSFASGGVTMTTNDGNSSDTTTFVALFPDSTTGANTLHTDGGLTYNASTNALTATTFVGNVTRAGPLNISATGGTGVSINMVSNALLSAYRIEMTAASGVSLVNGLVITPASSNTNIELRPDGTGDVYLTADTVRVGDSNANATITTNGTGDLILNTNSGTNSGSITIFDGVNADVDIITNGTGKVMAKSDILVVGKTNLNGMVTGNGTGILKLTANSSTDSSYIDINPALLGAGGITIVGDSTCPVSIESESGNVIVKASIGTVKIQSDTIEVGNNNAVNITNNNSITLTTSANNGDIKFACNGTGTVFFQDETLRAMVLKDYAETVYTAGSTTGTITPNVENGNVQIITLTGNITWNAFSSPATGQSMTMIIKQPASGGPYTLTSTMKFAGGSKTLSTAANAIDIVSVFYDGTDYLASLAKGFA